MVLLVVATPLHRSRQLMTNLYIYSIKFAILSTAHYVESIKIEIAHYMHIVIHVYTKFIAKAALGIRPEIFVISNDHEQLPKQRL